MNPRLVNLLASFIRATSDYALARLEWATAHPDQTPPPILPRLPDASERTLRERWDGVEEQLAEIGRWLEQRAAPDGTNERADPPLRWLRRLARELDQYARALRWVLTVEGDDR